MTISPCAMLTCADCQETVCDSKIDTKFAVLFSRSQIVSWGNQSAQVPSQHCIGGTEGGRGVGESKTSKTKLSNIADL